jgi:hypothetical protein
MAGLGFSSSAPYNQDEEVRRFQEKRRAEERERIRREQEAQQQRRRGYRPEDPQMGPDGRPIWPYDRPYVGPRVTGEVIRVLDNVPGVNRITGPAIMVADGISGKTPAPGEGPMPSVSRGPYKPRKSPHSGLGPGYGSWKPTPYDTGRDTDPPQVRRKKATTGISAARKQEELWLQRRQSAVERDDPSARRTAENAIDFYRGEQKRLSVIRDNLPYEKPRGLASDDPRNAASPSTSRVREHRRRQEERKESPDNPERMFHIHRRLRTRVLETQKEYRDASLIYNGVRNNIMRKKEMVKDPRLSPAQRDYYLQEIREEEAAIGAMERRFKKATDEYAAAQREFDGLGLDFNNWRQPKRK